MRIFFSVILLLFCAASIARAQAVEWQSLKTDDGEFSFSMPANCHAYFYDKTGFMLSKGVTHQSLEEMQLVNCYRNGTLMSVEIYRTKKPKSLLGVLSKEPGKRRDKIKLNVSQPASGFEYPIEKSGLTGVTRYVAGKNRIYLITAATRGGGNATYQKFLDSVKFFAADPNGILISSLTSIAPEITLDEDSLTVAPPVAAPQNSALVEDASVKKLAILFTVRAGYTDAARQQMTAGNVVLRLTLGANGTIEKAKIIKPLPDGLVRNALIASLRMKFLPEERDGKAVPVEKTLEYGFNIY